LFLFQATVIRYSLQYLLSDSYFAGELESVFVPL